MHSVTSAVFRVLLHALCPETLPAAADIPVAHLVRKILQRLCCLGNAVLVKIPVHLSHHGVQSGKQPLIHHRQFIVIQRVFRRIEIVDICVEHIKIIGIPQLIQEFMLSLQHRLSREPLGQPRGGAGIKIPPDGVRAVILQRLKGIHHIALGFRHLLSVLIHHQPQHNDILVRGFVKEQGGFGQQGIKPPPRLIHGLRDKLSRELLLEQLFIFKGIMMLGKRHGSGIKPAVNHLRHPLHGFPALRAGECDGVDVGPVQLHALCLFIPAQGGKLLPASHAFHMPALALPNIQRRSPIAVSGDAPVLDIFQPVAETSLADGWRNPVDGLVIAHQIILYRSHLDKP